MTLNCLTHSVDALRVLGIPDRDSAVYTSVVPKDPILNMLFRRDCIAAGYESPVAAQDLWIMCARDPLFFINTFVFLLETRDKQDWNLVDRYGTNKVIPFITRGYQDDLILKAIRYLGRQDIVIPKSRETGISWIMVAIAAWDWLFHDQTHIGFVSKDLLSANNPDDPDALFSKFHFILQHLPVWMLAPTDYERNIAKNTFKNLRNQSSLTAYAAKADIGRGGRKAWMLMDEFHFFESGEDKAAMDSTVHVTPSRVFVSTANRDRGMAGSFYEVVTDATKNGVVIVIDWKDDPDKARGLYHSELIPGTDTYKLVIDDVSFWSEYDNGDGTFRSPLTDGNYEFILDERHRSLYYDYVWHRPGSTPQSVAAELDRNFGGATAQIFNPQLLQRALASIKPPLAVGDIIRDGEKRPLSFCVMAMGGSVELWVPLSEQGEPPLDEYVFGADIAAGTAGAWSSYSALSGLNKRTGEQVFQWRSNRVDPLLFADIAVWVCKWFHNAYFIPEVNGPLGTIFINKVAMTLNYPNIYRRVKAGIAYKDKTEKIGYLNSDRGIELLKTLESNMRKGRVKPHSRVALTELGQYFMKNGKLVHSGAETTDDGAAMGTAHGDAAISLGCASFGIDDIPPTPEEKVVSEAPVMSFAWRREQFMKQIAARTKKPYWDG